MAGRKIVIIAGPNGAGKTTFAESFLPNEAGCSDFLNADLIARGLSPFEPEKVAIQAGKLLLTEIERRIEAGRSFSFETTLSGKNYARRIPFWRSRGYYIKLIFLSLPSADIAIERVKARVVQGGHNISDNVVRRRFEIGLRNFEKIYQNLVDHWAVYDNAGQRPLLIENGDAPGLVKK